MPGNVPPVADEREGLLAFLAQQRYVLTLAAYGLTDEQARMTPSSSQLSVGGLVKHVTATERAWMDRAMLRPVRGEGVDDYVAHFRMSQDQNAVGRAC